MTDDYTDGDLDQLRRQRATLDAEIRRREATQQEDYNTQLDQLRDAVLAFVDEQGLPLEHGERKNVLSVSVNGVITIEFGHHSPDMGRRGFLAVSDSSSGMQAAFGGHAELPGGLPTAAGLLGLIAGQLSVTSLNSANVSQRDGNEGDLR